MCLSALASCERFKTDPGWVGRIKKAQIAPVLWSVCSLAAVKDQFVKDFGIFSAGDERSYKHVCKNHILPKEVSLGASRFSKAQTFTIVVWSNPSLMEARLSMLV